MPMKNNVNPPKNHTSIKTRFAMKFLESMKKLNKTPSISEKYKRYQAVRAAAWASMASAAGPKRAWSRAVLRKIRRHPIHHHHPMNKTRRRRFARREKVLRANPRENLGFRQEEDLRCLVPGGEEMGLCRLLSETAHYINCLKTQVQVMKNILDHLST